MELPAQFDGFFNPTTMQHLGIDTEKSLSESLQILTWFATLLIRLHPSCWALLNEDDQLRPVSFFMWQSWPQEKEESIVKVLEVMVVSFKRADWVMDLLPYKAQVASWPKLIELLPAADREAMLMDHIGFTESYGSYQFLTQPDSPGWSKPFSEWVWVTILKSWVKQPNLQGAERQFFRDAITVIHPEIILRS